MAAILAGLLVALLPVAHAATTATGTGSGTLAAYVEVRADDNSISLGSATPSDGDRGPRAFSTADYFQFQNGDSNKGANWDYDVTAATLGGSSSLTVKGASHTVADWLFAMQDANTKFSTVEATGVYDSNAAGYTAPGGFTKDSQGTFTIKHYANSNPTDGGTSATVYWIYEISGNRYMIDATDADFTSGASTVYPVTSSGQAGYEFTAQGNKYVITSVAGAGSNYVPTVKQGLTVSYSTAGAVAKQVYFLVDYPDAAPAGSLSFTLTTTATST